MYNLLIVLHSALRWLVLAALVAALLRAGLGYFRQRPFTRADNALRHWTATLAHLQLIIGVLLYLKSPIPAYFWMNLPTAAAYGDLTFFSVYHLGLMLTAIIVLTIGSALAKRRATDRLRFSTMLSWYGFALLLILAAIPWPFLPYAPRPYFRTF